MQTTREFAVDHKDWVNHMERLLGSELHDPKPGEEKLVLTRCHAVRMQGTQIVIEAVYEEPTPLVVIMPPPVAPTK